MNEMARVEPAGELVRVRTADGICRITLANPPANALSMPAMAALQGALDAARDDEAVRVVVIAGEGKVFCAGHDLKEMTAHRKDADAGRDWFERTFATCSRLMQSIPAHPKPVIAEVDGIATAAGCQLVAACDLAIASDKAIFGQVGPKVGSVDPGFGTAFLARVVGEKKAREIWYLCRRYSAQEALAMGLVNAVVPHDQLDAEVDRWCAEILDKSPTAIAIAKRSFNADSDSIRGIASLGMQALALYYDTPESHEGVEAFLQKRKPSWLA